MKISAFLIDKRKEKNLLKLKLLKWQKYPVHITLR